MKKLFLLLTLFCFHANAQVINFSDPNFKAILLQSSTSSDIARDFNQISIKIDTNNDGEIQVNEALQVYTLHLNGTNISDVTGINNFMNLRKLICDINPLLTSLDTSGLTNLESLYCPSNELTSLNVNGLTNLKELFCSGNQLSILNISDLINLEKLGCDSNLISSLNLSDLTNLQELYCSNNQLTSLNTNNLTNLVILNCSDNQITSLNVSDSTNLQELSCTNNQFTTLNVSSLTNLQSFNCSNNQLTSLNVNGLVNLGYFICDYNQLTSLNLTGLTNLGLFSCEFNQLSSLYISNLLNLSVLDCSYNQLVSLDASGLTNLRELICTNNQLTSLNVDGLINVFKLECSMNHLTTLNLNGLTKLQMFECIDNSLTSLFVKNGMDESVIRFQLNPNLEYVCADESQISSLQSLANTFGYNNFQVNSYCSFTPGGDFYTIQGSDKFDNDNNGCDASDIVYPNFKLSFSDGINSGNLIADATGNYNYKVQAGTHTITPIFENPTYFSASPATVNVTFPTQASPFTQDFCITANGVHPDLEVTLLPMMTARPGFDANYKIIYKNKGNTTQSGTVNLTFNDAILDLIYSNPVVSNQTADNLSWNFSNLLPFETREITITLNVNSPMETPAVNIGDVLNYTATIASIATDETPNDNTFIFNQTVVNSLDPNNKTCLEGNTIAPGKVGDYVHYMIRFENTGTFPAQNIVVKDMIDMAKFDVNSIVPIRGSHSFVTNISSGNKVEFIFENINLPFDDANNDGYVVFKIRTKPTLVLGNTFSNTSSIYFDYNFPIATNTATTTIQALDRQDFEFSNYFSLYPNPVHDVLNITAKEIIEITSVNVYNTLGQLVLAIPNAENSKTIDVSRLTSGNYFIKINSDKGTANTKFIKN